MSTRAWRGFLALTCAEHARRRGRNIMRHRHAVAAVNATAAIHRLAVQQLPTRRELAAAIWAVTFLMISAWCMYAACFATGRRRARVSDIERPLILTNLRL